MRQVVIITVALVLFGAVVFYGLSCGSGGGNGGFAPPAEPNPSPAGIWLGQFTSTSPGPSFNPNRQVVGIISEDLEAQFSVSMTPLHYAGVVAMDGDALTGTLSAYLGKRGSFAGFDGLQSIVLDGTVVEGDGIFGEYTGAEDQGRFNLIYDSIYERDSSLDLTSGIWQFNLGSAGGDVYVVTLDIDDNGQLFGSDTAGCVFSGQVRIIDGRYNAYRMAVGISSCGDLNGEYSGLACLLDAAGGEMNQLAFNLRGARFAFAAGLGRM